jgi:hypothetical protein
MVGFFRAVLQRQAFHRSGAQLLMTHPGVGPVTALGITALFFSDKQLMPEIRAEIDRRDGVVKS